jgi:hypothetical protein
MYKVIKYKFSCYDFVERDLFEWLAGLEPGQVMKVIGQKVEMKVIGQKVLTS